MVRRLPCQGPNLNGSRDVAAIRAASSDSSAALTASRPRAGPGTAAGSGPHSSPRLLIAAYRGPMQQALDPLAVSTRGAGLYEITGDVAGWVRGTGFQLGLLTVFCRHTSAGLLITENASPAVWRDLQRWMSHVVP